MPDRSPTRLLVIVGLWSLLAGSGSFARQVAPAISSQTQYSVQQGSSTRVLVDGINLEHASRVLFNHPGLSARILKHRSLPYPPKKPGELGENVVRTEYLHDGSTKDRLRLEIVARAEVPPGIYALRLLIPLGATDLARLAVTPFPNVTESAENDSVGAAEILAIPATVNGEISQVEDIDFFRFRVATDQELVFRVRAQSLGSSLDSLLTLWDTDGRKLAWNDDFKGADSVLIHRFKEPGEFLISIADRLGQGGGKRFYMLEIGELPFVTSFSPLGLVAHQTTRLELEGANLGGTRTVEIEAEESGWGDFQSIAPGPAVNIVRFPVASYPITPERDSGTDHHGAQLLKWPTTVEGSLPDNDVDWYTFEAVREQTIVLEVEASRIGSSLDSVIQIFDFSGQPVPRGVVRCLARTEMTRAAFNNRSSASIRFRLDKWDDFSSGDLAMIGNELVEVQFLPRTADDDMVVANLMGQRFARYGTTPVAHPAGTPVYRARILPPDSRPTPNGMPVFELDFRNDDGGPLLGRDSLLTFTAPHSGAFLVKFSDASGDTGRWPVYRLTLREPAPDFKLFPGPVERPSLPLPRKDCFNLFPGGATPLTVAAYRVDGFDGPIEIHLENLPRGVRATRATIPSGETYAVVVLSADWEASFEPGPLEVVGTAKINGRPVKRRMATDFDFGLVALTRPGDLHIRIVDRELRVSPGEEITATVEITRADFDGRVPITIVGLPAGIQVVDVGLNGVLVRPEESRLQFTLYAEPWVKEKQVHILATAEIESDSPVPTLYASPAVALHIRTASPLAEGSAFNR